MSTSVYQPQSTFVIPVRVPRQVGAGRVSREDFFAALWNDLGSKGLVGVHEGTVLTESLGEELPAEWGEQPLWDVDAGLAPASRDWVSSQGEESAELYFADEASALNGRRYLIERWLDESRVGELREQKPEDWDAKWKASFKGVEVPPYWHILPPWEEAPAGAQRVLRLNPGAGFGTGTHETTQLCLTALANLTERAPLDGVPVLDFGSGSGILSVAAALLGASVDGVEIDPLAIDNAVENAELNSMQDRVRYCQTLEELADPARRYPVVIANILKTVLIPFADELVARLDAASPQASVILSGLTHEDADEVRAVYESKLPPGFQCEVRELREWRALVWRRV